MRKVIIIFFVAISIFFGFTSISKAQLNCNNWVCDPLVCNPITGGCSSFCRCDDGVTFGSNCGSGYYSCNNGCCPVGSVPPVGGGGGGGAGSDCRPLQVNCPSGGTINLSSPSGASFCAGRLAWEDCFSTLGTAQRQVGCCGTNSDGDCNNPRIQNYGCCPAGTTPTLVTTQGGTYIRRNDCRPQYSTVCNDADDLYISHLPCITPSDFSTRGALTTCRTVTSAYVCVSNTPTCTVDVTPRSIPAGTSTLFPASIPASSGVITQVNFVSSNPSVATVTTPADIQSCRSRFKRDEIN